MWGVHACLVQQYRPLSTGLAVCSDRGQASMSRVKRFDLEAHDRQAACHDGHERDQDRKVVVKLPMC